nr:helix-turn-helix domain-containing protein [uncultured Sphaerochaeta sp.]
MLCQKCGDTIEAGDEREYCGQTLCEDCYMDVLSPAKTCDPWAVFTAKSIPKTLSESRSDVSPIQQMILDALEETGGIQPPELCERLQIKPSDLEREVAALRHMEKIRGELRDGKRYIVRW